MVASMMTEIAKNNISFFLVVIVAKELTGVDEHDSATVNLLAHQPSSEQCYRNKTNRSPVPAKRDRQAGGRDRDGCSPLKCLKAVFSLRSGCRCAVVCLTKIFCRAT
jgi:hypothetical protein